MRARNAAGSRPLITVITVVFNNRDGFAGTAASVCEQKDASFEWVVIDGGSTDLIWRGLAHGAAVWVICTAGTVGFFAWRLRLARYPEPRP